MSSLAVFWALAVLSLALGENVTTTMEPVTTAIERRAGTKKMSCTDEAWEPPGASNDSTSTTDIISQLKINDALARRARYKRNMRNKHSKRGKSNHSINDAKPVEITKYNKKGVVFALKVTEGDKMAARGKGWNFNARQVNETSSTVDYPICNVYIVTKIFACDSSEGVLFFKGLGTDKYKKRVVLAPRKSSKLRKNEPNT